MEDIGGDELTVERPPAPAWCRLLLDRERVVGPNSEDIFRERLPIVCEAVSLRVGGELGIVWELWEAEMWL